MRSYMLGLAPWALPTPPVLPSALLVLTHGGTARMQHHRYQSVLQKTIPSRLHTMEARYQDFSVVHCAQEYRLLEVNKPLGVLVQTSVSRTFAPVW